MMEPLDPRVRDALRQEAYGPALQLDAVTLRGRLVADDRSRRRRSFTAVAASLAGVAVVLALVIRPIPAMAPIGGDPSPSTCLVSPVTMHGSWWAEIGGPQASFNIEPEFLYAGPNAWRIITRFDPDAPTGGEVAVSAEHLGTGEVIRGELNSSMDPTNIYRFDEPAPSLPGGWYLFEQRFPTTGCWRLSASIDGDVVGQAILEIGVASPILSPSPDLSAEPSAAPSQAGAPDPECGTTTSRYYESDENGSQVPIVITLTCEAAVAAATNLVGPDPAITRIQFGFGLWCPPGARCMVGEPNAGFVIFHMDAGPSPILVSVSADATGTVTASDPRPIDPVVPPPIPSTSTPASSPGATEQPALSCGAGGIEFPSSVLSGPPMLTGPDAAMSALQAIADGGYPGMPASGWRTVAATEASLTFLAEGADKWWFVTVEGETTGGWTAWEYGECHLAVVLPDALVYAQWRLDLEDPPGPGATDVAVLATEQACANGQPPGSRLLAPVVVETATTVTITLTVRRLGNADCPGNPEVSVVVPLQAPLGKRTLLDGSTVPPAAR